MSNSPTPQTLDIGVLGGGPAGLAAALATAEQGRKVLVLAQPPAGADRPANGSFVRDTRTTAIIGDGINFLHNLSVWQQLGAVSAPISGIRIVDDRDGWISAPEVLFDAREVDRAHFGYNVPNDPLRDALWARVGTHPQITLVPTAGVVSITPGLEYVTLKTVESGEYRVQLLIAADGRNSIARAAAGITARTWKYPQVAIATSFAHSQSHKGVSSELHRRAGPLTTVPLPDASEGPQSSLVWIETPDEADRLMALNDAAFLQILQARLGAFLGRLHSVRPRATFPIAGLMATLVAKSRIVLAGEAAHVIPPIGAQGLNLGFRDAAAIADALAEATHGDPGESSVLAAYARARASDLMTREIGVDLLNRSLLIDFLPVQALRGLSLHALANSRLLRRATMQMGMSGPGRLPTLMRPLANVVRDGGYGHAPVAR